MPMMMEQSKSSSATCSRHRRRSISLFVLVALCCVSDGLAVDKSKFRTCKQTGFCRRHRDNHSVRLYNYRLQKDSVKFHLPTREKKDEKVDIVGVVNNEEEKDGGKRKNIWSSISKVFLGGNDEVGEDGSTMKDRILAGNNEAHPLKSIEPTLTGTLINYASETSTALHEELSWSLYTMHDGMIRVRITEVYGKSGTAYENPRVTYDSIVLEADAMEKPANHANLIKNFHDNDLFQQLASSLPGAGSSVQQEDNYMALEYGDTADQNMILLIRLKPFALYLYRKNDSQNGPIIIVGDQGQMHFEIRRAKTELNAEEEKDKEGEEKQKKEGEIEEKDVDKAQNKEEKEIVGYWEDGLAIYADGTREEKQEEEDHRRLESVENAQGDLDRSDLWEEKFQSHHDSKPYGPMSVGMDISFPKSKHLFGIPEHASSTKLRSTLGENSKYSEPYRLYNLDVFEYDLDETMALYGQIPLIVSQSVDTGTTGMFWFNPTETFVDVDETMSTTHFFSESGIIDLFLIPGSTPTNFYHQYATLTGKVTLPPMFSLGYHQCRWNYKDEKDVYTVHDTFEKYDYPYDVLWLDIEHTDGKRYFTWDKQLFPNPIDMQNKLASQGRKMVTIVDPHIKRDDNYYVHKKATNLGLYIRDKDNEKDYDGWCWPGSSSYLDFTNSAVRKWWASQFSYDKYIGSTETLYTWNDMNEPSVFNGPEVSMQKDLRNLADVEHREWHNLYGMLFHRATSEGLVERNKVPIKEKFRSFVLSRAFFAGSQKYGAIWTGDNEATWEHLQIAAPMLLSLNLAGLPFVGADVGGFFGDPDAELFIRWMQAGAYQPFFRGHAHHDSKRREPWTYGGDTLVKLRKSAMARYALLPMWYTLFHVSSVSGLPIMRTMWMQYPQTEELFAVDDQYLIGSDLLVKPITAPGITSTNILFPTDDIWYDAELLIAVTSDVVTNKFREIRVPSDIDTIPVYQRGGSIIPRKLRLRRSSQAMINDPYTLYIALNHNKQATGGLYMDDELTLSYTEGAFAEAKMEADFTSKDTVISNTMVFGPEGKILAKADRMIERIIIMGVDGDILPKHLVGANDEEITFHHDESSGVLVLRKPNVSAMEDWEIKAQF